jgi:hypothetical protein
MLTEIITESTREMKSLWTIFRKYMSRIFLGKRMGRPEDGRWPAVEFGLMLV